jgi:DNA-directed RNA polymerase I subunit RPA2
MMRKLYALVNGECAEDNQDAVVNQEVLLAGQLYGLIFKEKLQDWMLAIKQNLLREVRMKKDVELEDCKASWFLP